jgi:hypothetical protein
VSPAFRNDAEGIELDHLKPSGAPMFMIEEDRGTYTRNPHPHNGYYAGDFSGSTDRPATPVSTTVVRTTAHPTERVFA